MAKITVNADQSLVQVQFPDGSESDVYEWPEDNFVLFPAEAGEPPYLVALQGLEGLQANTLYKLIEVPATVETAEFEDAPEETEPADGGEGEGDQT